MTPLLSDDDAPQDQPDHSPSHALDSTRENRPPDTSITDDFGDIARLDRQLVSAPSDAGGVIDELILNSIGEGIHWIDRDGRIVYENRAAARLLGWKPQELVGRMGHATMHHTRVDGAAYPPSECPIYQGLRTGHSQRVEGELFWRKDGTSFPVDYTATPVCSDSGESIGSIVVFRDVTDRWERERERESALREAQDRADRDTLTGLWNHRAFHARLQEAVDRTERDGTTLAVAIIDLDDFKYFNDAYGHAAGDAVLLRIAERLQSVCRPYDTVARFGGDEFALLLHGVKDITTAQIEARLQADLAGMTVCPTGDEAIPIVLSIGAALFGAARDGEGDPLRRADERLLRAKTGGDTETDADRLRASLTAGAAGFSMLDALVAAVDNKDRYTRRHSEDVMRYSLMIARQIGLDDDTLRTVAAAALLHDVGKIGVPDAVLRKPGKLTGNEFEAIKQHPEMGAAIVGAVPALASTLDAISHHHERWDGGGYPAGLRETETPLIARLMAVADAFSAMTTDRPYRKGMPTEKALSILETGSGSQWDAHCAAAFRKALLGDQEDAAPIKAAFGVAVGRLVPSADDETLTVLDRLQRQRRRSQELRWRSRIICQAASQTYREIAERLARLKQQRAA